MVLGELLFRTNGSYILKTCSTKVHKGVAKATKGEYKKYWYSLCFLRLLRGFCAIALESIISQRSTKGSRKPQKENLRNIGILCVFASSSWILCNGIGECYITKVHKGGTKAIKGEFKKYWYSLCFLCLLRGFCAIALERSQRSTKERDSQRFYSCSQSIESSLLNLIPFIRP